MIIFNQYYLHDRSGNEHILGCLSEKDSSCPEIVLKEIIHGINESLATKESVVYYYLDKRGEIEVSCDNFNSDYENAYKKIHEMFKKGRFKHSSDK